MNNGGDTTTFKGFNWFQPTPRVGESDKDYAARIAAAMWMCDRLKARRYVYIGDCEYWEIPSAASIHERPTD